MIKFKLFRFIFSYFNPITIKKVLSFFSYYFGGLFKRADEHHIFLFGGGLAFSLFICIIPMILIVFSILGSVIDPIKIEVNLDSFIQTIIPYETYSDYVKNIIVSRILEVVEYRTEAGYIGGIGLFITASGLFSSMRTVLNRIFGVTNDKHALIGKLRDFGMIVLLVVFILLSTFIFPIINLLITATEEIKIFNIITIPFISNFMFNIITSLIIFLMFFIFYYFIPYEKIGKLIPLISAFWATILWVTAKIIFGYYLSNFAVYNKIYGTYAVVVVVAFWIYYTSILFILGAEIGQLFRERQEILDIKKEN